MEWREVAPLQRATDRICHLEAAFGTNPACYHESIEETNSARRSRLDPAYRANDKDGVGNLVAGEFYHEEQPGRSDGSGAWPDDEEWRCDPY